MVVRLVTAAAVLVSAVVHGILWWFLDYRAIEVVGPAFLLNAVAGVVIAVLLVTWQHWVPPFLATGFGASTLGAFVVSATVGLFGVHEHWTGGWVLTAAVSEIVCIAGGLHLLWPYRPARMRHQGAVAPLVRR